MNIELLKEDIKFPFHYDGISYIWDDAGNMVAMSLSSDERMYEVVVKLNAFALNDFHYDNSGYRYQKVKDVYITLDGEPFILIRGWGRLSYKENAFERQNNIVDFFLMGLNETDSIVTP